MSLPNLSRLSEPTSTKLGLFTRRSAKDRDDASYASRNDPDHKKAMAVLALHTQWKPYIEESANSVNITTLQFSDPNRDWYNAAERFVAIFAFFAPLDQLNYILERTKYSQFAYTQRREYFHSTSPPKITEADVFIQPQPYLTTEGRSRTPYVQNPACELNLVINVHDYWEYRDSDRFYGSTNDTENHEVAWNITIPEYQQMILEILQTAGADSETDEEKRSLEKKLFNNTVREIWNTLHAVARAHLGPLKTYVRGIVMDPISLWSSWYGPKRAQLPGEGINDFLWRMISVELMKEFSSHFYDVQGRLQATTTKFYNATKNRNLTHMGTKTRHYGRYFQIELMVHPSTPIIRTNEFLPSPPDPLKPYQDRNDYEAIGWMCSTDPTEVMIAPNATYTFHNFFQVTKDTPNFHDWQEWESEIIRVQFHVSG